MTNLKLCNHCERRFKGKPHRKYCSNECYTDYRRSKIIYKQCTECGETITRPPKHFARVEKPFCSRKCRNKHMTGENHHAHIPKGECPTCGVPLSRARAKHCSAECAARSGEDSPLFIERDEIPCDHCGEIMLRTKTSTNAANFCTKECKNAFHAEAMRGKNNPRYKDGIWGDRQKAKRSYAGFTLKLRKAIRKRDKNTCQVCAKTKKEHGMNMHVHHIDYKKENNSPDNLICVCRFCHGVIHGEEVKWQEILLRKLKY